MRLAVVDQKTGQVVNIINAEPWDTPPVGCTLVEIPAEFPVDHRWELSKETQTFDSKDEVVVAGRIEATRLEAEKVEYQRLEAEKMEAEKLDTSDAEVKR